MRFESIVDAIGHTPVVRLRAVDNAAHSTVNSAVDSAAESAAGSAVELYAKLELQNPFAMKDRVAKQVILQARRAGLLAPGAPIVESSSGTMALGLALVGAALGHPVHIVTDPRIDPITMAKLRALGCAVHVVPAMGQQGWQSARLERLATLRRELPGSFWPQQYSNPLNPQAYEALAQELVSDLGRVDVLVGSAGSGGSLCGTARALRERLGRVRVVAVDCVGSVLFGQPDKPERLQSGLGNSIHPENLDLTVIDEVQWLNDREAFDATRALAREQAIFAGNSAGSVYHVMKGLVGRLEPGTRVVGILPDRGDRYVSSVYSDVYWAENGLDRLPAPAQARQVTRDSPVASWSYAQVDTGPRRELVFIESNTTGTGMLALRQAAALGLRPVLLTSRPDRYLGLDEASADVVRCDTNDVEVLRSQLRKRSRAHGVAGVTTTSEFYLVPTAVMASCLHLPGNSAEAVAVCRDKARTRAVLSRCGIPQPRYVTVRSVDELPAAITRIGLPCVVKPTADSASTGVLLCTTGFQVEEHTRTLLATAVNVRGQATSGMVLLEQYLAGAEVSVETFAENGDITVVGITDKTVGDHPHFVELGHAFPTSLDASTVQAVVDATRQALHAVGLDHGAAHTEIRLTPDGPVVVEINARLAGGMIPELVRLATGVDLLEQQLRAAAGLPVDLDPRIERHAGIRFITADRAGILRGVRGVADARVLPGVRQVTVNRQPGAAVSPPVDAYGRIGFVIADADSAAQVRDALDAAMARIDVDVESDRGAADEVVKQRVPVQA